MPTEAIIETHVDPALLAKAQAIYAAAGVTLENLVRNMILKTVEDESVPMDFFRPNAETIEAIEAARRGEFEGTGSMSDLFAELDAED
jgi:DNA-damage-inducible protein J